MNNNLNTILVNEIELRLSGVVEGRKATDNPKSQLSFMQ